MDLWFRLLLVDGILESKNNSLPEECIYCPSGMENRLVLLKMLCVFNPQSTILMQITTLCHGTYFLSIVKYFINSSFSLFKYTEL